MERENTNKIKDLFHILLDNDKEAEIMDLIIDGKDSKELIEILIDKIKKGDTK